MNEQGPPGISLYTPIVIESPFAGDVTANIQYARDCLLDALARQEAPFLSHLLYPQALNDLDPLERSKGFACNFAFHKIVEYVVFYIDLGMSEGMLEALEHAIANEITIELRRIR